MVFVFEFFALLLAMYYDCVHCKHYVEETVSASKIKLHRNTRHRRLQTGIPYKVELLLALDYVNETVALQFEASATIPSTNATSYFCYAVNRQSSGNQVAFNAAMIGANIETRYVEVNDTGVDSQCTILATNRNMDVSQNVSTQGLFRLELGIGQIVYVQSNASTLSLDEVTRIVETGFSRGEGGRLRFRALLAPNPYFRTVVNVEVLTKLSIPSVPGGNATAAPNKSPTIISTTNGPSKPPSRAPTTAKPTPLILSQPPTTFPSTFPVKFSTRRPVGKPVTKSSPTSTPSAFPSEEPTLDTVHLSPSLSIPPLSSSIKPSPSPSSEEKSNNKLETIVGVVIAAFGLILATLFFLFCIWFPFCASRKYGSSDSQENASGSFPGQGSILTPVTYSMAIPGVLTLDEDAQSLANTTLDGKSSAPIFTSTQDNAASRPIQFDESFDESSIYTSTTDPSTPIGKESVQPPSSHDNLSDKSKIQGLDPVSQEQRLSHPKPGEPSNLKTKGFDPFDEENEHFADDESSLIFESNIIQANPNMDLPSQTSTSAELGSDEASNGENLTANMFQESHLLPDDHCQSIKQMHNINGENNKNLKHEGIDTLEKPKIPVVTLIEQFLSDTLKISTSKSVSSRQSAPSRLVAQTSQEHQMTHRRAVTDNDANLQRTHIAPRSIGPSFRARLLQSNGKSIGSSNGDHPLMNSTSISANGESSYDNCNYISNEPMTSGYDDPFLSEFVGLQMPSTGANIDSNDKWSHVAPRLPMSDSSYRDETDSPTMNSSRYGNYSSAESMYDSSSASGRSGSWHFDTDDHTFDSDSRTPDLQSSGSRSSRRSGRSLTSIERRKRGQDIIKSTKHESIYQNRIHTSGRSISGSKKDEQKSADDAAGPYKLQSELDYFGASSISESNTTWSGNRSTFSSKMDAQYKEQLEVLAPPGKINIVLVTDFHNGNGTVISKVRPTSTLQGKVHEGDELVAIDGDDVTNMVIAEITAMMASRAGRERKLTILRDPTSIQNRNHLSYQETKHEGSP